jgi:uncharacterized protein YjbI with pentapeptide repeats
MDDDDYIARLRQGTAAWNEWRKEHPEIQPDLRGALLARERLNGAKLEQAKLQGADLGQAQLNQADLSGADLSGAKMGGAMLNAAKLDGANLSTADMHYAGVRGASLRKANLYRAGLKQTDFSAADLTGVDLREANLDGTIFRGASLRQAHLEGARLNETNLEEADLTGAWVYGISAWNVKLVGAKQIDLVASRAGEPLITVDRIELAQLIYQLQQTESFSHMVDTMASKLVLILGRFTPERMRVLEGIREALRAENYVPVLFDFEKPKRLDLVEMVSVLGHLARFIIADITDPRSVPQELERIVPALPSVPVQPVIAKGEPVFATFEHLKRYPWMLELYEYENNTALLTALREKLIGQAELKANERTPG